jgi:Ca-activated chloride channel family protein
MSPIVIVVLVVLALLIGMYLFGLSPEPAGRRKTPGIIRRRSPWRRWLPVVPLLGAVACLVLAFTGFSVSFEESSPVIVLAVDASDSMQETDVAPNRLAAAENAARLFLDQLPSDFRVGLATFGAEATLAVPPTRERLEVTDAIDGLETTFGTVIGDGLDTALDAIEAVEGAEDAGAAVVLLSDGRDTGSLIEPADAARRAASMSVPVYTVVIGQVDEDDERGGANLEALQEIARISDGETYTAETAGELTTLYERLGSQLTVDLKVDPSTTPLVVAAIVLVVLAGLLLLLTPR